MARLARESGHEGAGRSVTSRAVSSATTTGTWSLEELVGRRASAGERFFAAEAERIARLCHTLAERFTAGGRLLAIGASPQTRSDARHVAVEFVHPVIVGKRALPALALVPDGGSLAAQAELLLEPRDMVIAFGVAESFDAAAALALARSRGCLTIAFENVDADWVFVPRCEDPFVAQELVETLYHVLWELVHVFFEHLDRSSSGGGASSFLYPFLSAEAGDVEAVVDDVRGSVMMKAQEASELRERTVLGSRDELVAAANTLRAAFAHGGRLFAFGNGGSATDAMDVVADFRSAPQGWPALAEVDLTEDTSILTALANDIGPHALFQRQLIAHGRVGDVALALSTSGGSENIIEALAEARRRDLRTIAFVGYDGGRILAERLADHVIVTPSEHIPRIQEAQATGYHVLRELVGVNT